MEQQIMAMWAQVWVTAGVGVLQCLLIAGGLWMMKLSGERRDRALDQQEQRLEQQGKALERQGEVLAELLRRSNPA